MVIMEVECGNSLCHELESIRLSNQLQRCSSSGDKDFTYFESKTIYRVDGRLLDCCTRRLQNH